ncbi:hypothetical protein TSOC_008139, partial [Tetrabaena socialis]
MALAGLLRRGPLSSCRSSAGGLQLLLGGSSLGLRRRQRLCCHAGLMTAPSVGNAPQQSTAFSSLRSVSYDELDLDTSIAYELYQGPLVRWSHTDATHVPPTAVMVHGILGNRKNMSGFAKMLVE